MGDPLDDYERRELAFTMWLERRPICYFCNQNIQDESAIRIDAGKEDIWICDNCARDPLNKEDIDE